MKTIKERAIAYSKTQAIECYAYCGYERGAAEQKMIDIAKSSNEFSRFLDSLVVLYPELKETIELQRITWISSFKEKITED